MCGISAIIDRSGGRVDVQLVEAMNARVAHRGPNGEGVFEGPSFALGHRRLAILDLSVAGHQPMELDDRSVITYNGEIYNYLELRDDLRQRGYQFHTTSDTEVLLAAYDCWGPRCVERLNGMWAFVLWDRKRDVLFASRDRFGVKPLHYVELGRFLAIASEVKQFLALPDFVPAVDPRAAYRFLIDGALGFDDRDFVAGVRSLRGGHNLHVDLRTGQFRVDRWYDLAARKPNPGVSFDDAAEQFRELLFDAVRIRLRSDVTVGVCLSGGVDSSSIASVARRVTPAGRPVRSVSCAWDDPACDESRFIDEVVRSCQLDPVIARPKMDDQLDRHTLDKIIYHQDQPILSASQFAEYSVYGAARQHGLVVMLNGQGADEYLGGYSWCFPPFIRSLLSTGEWATALHEVRARARLRVSPLHAGIRSLWNSLAVAPLRDVVRGSAGHRPLDDWAGPALQGIQRDGGASVARYYGADSLTDLSLRELLDTSIPLQLHSDDRNSMLHSIESRLPFMDYRLVELGLSLPDTFKVRDGATKAVLRRGLQGVLPDAIRHRHDKVGFPAPEEAWMTHNAPFVRAELRAAAERYPEFIGPTILDRFDLQLARNTPYDPVFFRIVALNRWATVFVRSPRAAYAPRSGTAASHAPDARHAWEVHKV